MQSRGDKANLHILLQFKKETSTVSFAVMGRGPLRRLAKPLTNIEKEE